MNVTKFSHCCLLIEIDGVRILTDPGSYSMGQNEAKNIDIVLITHEHQDHLHIDSLKTVIANTEAKGLVIITNKGVGKLLEASGIQHYEVVEHGQGTTVKGVLIEGFGTKHAEIYKTVIPADNTGYFIANKLFYPGDTLTHPGKHVDVLALPVAGPWLKISEAIEYALAVKPKTAFPVHDGMFQKDRGTIAHRVPGQVLPSHGIEFVVIEEGEMKEFT